MLSIKPLFYALCIATYIYILANSLSPVIWYSYVPANLSLSMIT